MFRRVPPQLVPLTAVAVFAASLAVLASGRWLIGSILLVAAIALLLVPHQAGQRRARRTIENARARAGFAADSVWAWSKAGRELAALRRELRRLGSQRHERLRALGEAALREDDAAIAERKAEIQALDEDFRRHEADVRRIVDETRQGVERRRRTFQPTKIIAGRLGIDKGSRMREERDEPEDRSHVSERP